MCGDYPVAGVSVEQGIYQAPYVAYGRGFSTSVPLTPLRLPARRSLRWLVVPQTARSAFQYDNEGLHTSAADASGPETFSDNGQRFS
jgi:hypothetical protein